MLITYMSHEPHQQNALFIILIAVKDMQKDKTNGSDTIW